MNQWTLRRPAFPPQTTAGSSTMGGIQRLLGRFCLLAATLSLAVVGLRMSVPLVSFEMRVAPARLAPDTAKEFGSAVDTLVSAGGLRMLAGDVLWLRTHQAWVRRDLVATRARLNLAVSANPRPLAFWLNGARMLAYDMPEWRIARAGRSFISTAIWQRIAREQAEQALAWLDRAGKFHPYASEIFVERALIQLYCLRDNAAAAENFRLAAELPGAPGYASRLQVVLLQRLRRNSSAGPWPGLPHQGSSRSGA